MFFCLSALFVKNHIDYSRLEQAYAVSEESLKTQLSNLRDLHEEELRRRDEALEEYRETISVIREDYENAHIVETDPKWGNILQLDISKFNKTDASSALENNKKIVLLDLYKYICSQ